MGQYLELLESVLKEAATPEELSQMGKDIPPVNREIPDYTKWSAHPSGSQWTHKETGATITQRPGQKYYDLRKNPTSSITTHGSPDEAMSAHDRPEIRSNFNSNRPVMAESAFKEPYLPSDLNKKWYKKSKGGDTTYTHKKIPDTTITRKSNGSYIAKTKHPTVRHNEEEVNHDTLASALAHIKTIHRKNY
jgi:hypothetical protein